ncbi:MAG: TIGR03862 family flavoprotein [Octadecabacter sp.]|nr:TIGR03862 family flavoprotein [Octadecabacter sp.]
MTDALVIGAGPAGLMAADILSAKGHSVMLADAMPTFGRKFLMAGKSGLNITKAEPDDVFAQAYAPALDLDGFGPEQVAGWTRDLGQDVFTGSTGRVFPTVMKASPLLRAWRARLAAQGVAFHTRWRWTGWDESGAALFDTPVGQTRVASRATVLALGGASWKRLGSDGAWAGLLAAEVAPFKPANIGFEVPWSRHMEPFYGAAVKGCRLMAGGAISRGEFVVSARGIEGGGIYALSAALRDGAALTVDLLPDLTVEQARAKVAAVSGKASAATVLRKAFAIDGVKRALFNEFGRDGDMVDRLKALPFPKLVPRPMDEAISTAGGVRFDALTDDLMLKSRAGVFCAGEMLDWEAPTGGYLITGCLATGRRAALGAAKFLA